MLSSLVSGIGDIGNSGLANGSSMGIVDALDVEILINDNGGLDRVDSKLTQNGQYLLTVTNPNLLYIHSLESSTLSPSSTQNLTQLLKYTLLRLLDLNPHLYSTLNNIAPSETVISLGIEEDNGTVFLASDQGRVYVMDCGWGSLGVDGRVWLGGLEQRDYVYRFVQEDIPVPVPVIDIVNTTNNTNATN